MGETKDQKFPHFPETVVEKSKWVNRKHKTQTLQSGMIEFDTLEVWSYNKT